MFPVIEYCQNRTKNQSEKREKINQCHNQIVLLLFAFFFIGFQVVCDRLVDVAMSICSSTMAYQSST